RAARPDDAVIAGNLASALAQGGDHPAALDILTAEVAAADPSLNMKRLRAFLAQETQQFSIAVPTYEEVVAAAPADWESWNNLGNARRLAGDIEGSVAALERAAELNPNSPPVRLNHAMALAALGRVDEAIEKLRGMADEFPSDTRALAELHAVLRELGREDDALDAIEEASARSPDDIELLLATASQRLNQLKTSPAEDSYSRVVQLEPGNALGNLGLAVVYELTNRTAELAELVMKAQERGVGDDVLNFIRAFDHRRGKRFAEGVSALDKVPDELETPRRSHLLGQLKEGVGAYNEAFAAFKRMNEIQLGDPTRPGERAEAYRNLVRTLSATVTPEWIGSWREETQPYSGPMPAFLLGFPRSGTTLLDTMLMGHDGVEVLEEEPTLLRASKILPFEDIPVASDEQIRLAREEYFRVAKLHAPLTPGKLLVDKNPLSLNALPIIKRLFPKAKIILALRHPCDVVLSCYITNFKLNDAMSNFLRLDTTAELYDLSFDFFEKARQLVDLPVHTVIYENVVGDRETELRALLDFLELDWSDEVLDHEATAMNRGRIKTASYSQVAEPIYNRAAGRWQNYRKHLEPVIPVLEPWIARFGYSL
ncbi:sulfotransferase, partial [Sphingomonas daechungensis]|uniref:tetratricopeptide repeat-containing sulfotransferase family protein n=1 Tax=Sphingomonas daechungensis TaxID=1176646 RepID=UPI003784BF5D